MKKLVPILFLINTLVLHSQWREDFNSNAFHLLNNTWNGDTMLYQINDFLQLNDTQAGSSLVHTNYSLLQDSMEWEFELYLPFSPSSSNNAQVFLFADETNPQLIQNGLYFQFGESGSNDAIRLNRIVNGSVNELWSGITGEIASGLDMKVTLRYIVNTGYQVFIENYELGNNYNSDTIAEASSIPSNGYFVFFNNYTTSNSSKAKMDNLSYLSYVPDVIPPQLIEISSTGNNWVEIVFNEFIDTNSILIDQIEIDGRSPTSIYKGETSSTLVFDSSLTNNSDVDFQINGIQDVHGNRLDTSGVYFSLYGFDPIPGRMIVNEFYPDPDTLLSTEYIELYNRSDSIFNLAQLMIWDANTSAVVEGDFLLYPNSYVVLSGDSIPFSGIDHIQVNLPSLNNESDRIMLSYNGISIDSVFYDASWDLIEKGRSVERINPIIPCNSVFNWSLGMDNSPGLQNAVFDTSFLLPYPSLDEILYMYSDSLILLTTEDEFPWGDVTFSLDLEFINELRVGLSSDSAELVLANNLPVNSKGILSIENILVCSRPVPAVQKIAFYVVDTPSTSDIIINEIYSDPKPFQEDYVELLNNSQKVIALNDLYWSNDHQDSIQVLDSALLLFPGEYLALSEDTSWIRDHFPNTPDSAGLVQVKRIPSLPNDEGNMSIYFDELLVDEVSYDPSCHTPLLMETEGVALERLNPKFDGRVYFSWTSGTTTSNFGTPGYPNDARMIFDTTGNWTVELKEAILSPNNDGVQDRVDILLKGLNDTYVTAEVFDLAGRKVHLIAQNYYINNEAILTWEGESSLNYDLASGIYLIRVSTFVLNGETDVRTVNVTLVK